jgi:ESCRT-II complex subunit VPS22
MRKGAGISALSRHTTTTSSFTALSTTLSASSLTTLQNSLAAFRDSLTAFAIAHKDDIRRDPAFRHQFQKMCAAIGVDPLAGSVARRPGSGLWAEMLGLSEMVYEISVQVVDVCVSTRSSNGGMIELADLTARVNRMRGLDRAGVVQGTVSQEDVLRAIDLLQPLHAGYTLVKNGHNTYVRSVPRELDLDQSTLLTIAAGLGGRLVPSRVKRMTGWNDVRTITALENSVMAEGMGWVDEQGNSGEREVWLIAAVSFDESV